MDIQKNKNNLLVFFCILASILAIYFGVKYQNLTQQLSNQNSFAKEVELSSKINDSISKIDSLLFKGAYDDALKITRELKQTNIFEGDTTLLLRYNLASELVAVKKLKIEEETRSSLPLKQNFAEKKVDNKVDTIAQLKNNKDQNSKIKNEPTKLVVETNANEYLTFATTKGTKLHYIGTIKDNNANGYGVAILESGSRYEGQWKNNKRHGYGKFFWDDGDYYEGTYRNDKRDGIGTYHWKNGEKYIGEWKNDQRNGEGQFYNKKGKLKTSGIWQNDELIEHKKKH